MRPVKHNISQYQVNLTKFNPILNQMLISLAHLTINKYFEMRDMFILDAGFLKKFLKFTGSLPKKRVNHFYPPD